MMDGRSSNSPLQIAIVGAGFSGSLLATHLLRAHEGRLIVTLIEQHGRPGRGIAYNTDDNAHLLNVRAAAMAAFPDDPGHFVRWLGGHAPPQAFVSRALYGDYIAAILADARVAAGSRLTDIAGDVVDLVPGPDGTCLDFSDGRWLTADAVVLCTGNHLPGPLAAATPKVLSSDYYFGNPWDFDHLKAVPPDASVLILGTGLTMVDTVLSLDGQGHRGPIIALSRRGLLPIAHAATMPFGLTCDPTEVPPTVRALMRFLRSEARRAELGEAGWRSAFDALRPYHQCLWQALTDEERRRFLRHVRPWWDMHRHRLAPAVAERFAGLLATGRVTIKAGRLSALNVKDGDFQATVVPRGDGQPYFMQVAAVVNATGPCADQSGDRLMAALVAHGLARRDRLGLGLEVAADGALLAADGQPSTTLFALGPMTRGATWEMTAVPELRVACADLGRCLAAKALALTV